MFKKSQSESSNSLSFSLVTDSVEFTVQIEVAKDIKGKETGKFILEQYSGEVHILRFNVSLDQQKWLASEINTVLANIRRQTETV